MNSQAEERITDHVVYSRKQLMALDLLKDRNKKYLMFWGGSRSGKTWLVIRAIRLRCHLYPGSKHLVGRYSFANAKKTIWLQTMLPQLRQDESRGICKISTNEGIVTYRNGSILMLGGLEPSRIDSVLAAEYETIFITEANENKFSNVENLFSRLNGITKHCHTGNLIPLKLIIDLNPTVDTSWPNVLFRRGLDPISGTPKQNHHEYADLHFNPEDNAANLADGYIDSLKALSPAKRKRFYEGEFGSVEGLVFNIDPDVHIVDDFEIPKEWKRIRSVDFGYTHPFVCLWSAYDSANETVYFYREHVQTEMTVRAHCEIIKRMSGEEIYSATVCDHDAEDRATMHENGIKTIPAVKEVDAGIDHVIDILHFDKDRRTRVKIMRSCTSLINGLYLYHWKDAAKGRAKDREVVKEDDDEADAFRYGLIHWFPIEKRFDFRRYGPKR